MPLVDDLREGVRAALAETHTSQAELARRLGITEKHVSQVLTGRAGLSPDLADAMLGALNYQPSVTVTAKETPVCPSTGHSGPTLATVPGQFVNPWNSAMNTRVVYCQRCADMLRPFGYFIPDQATA